MINCLGGINTMENIDQFIITCESNIIDIEYMDCAIEGIGETIKNGAKWMIKKAHDIIEKFIAFVRKFITKITTTISINQFEKSMRNKCCNKDDELFSYVKELDKTVLEEAFPGTNAISALFNTTTKYPIDQAIENYVRVIKNQSSYQDKYKDDVDRIYDALDSELPKIMNVINKGFDVNEERLKKLEDESDNLKDEKQDCYPIKIASMVNNYKSRLNEIMNQYPKLKAILQRIQNSLQVMNRDLRTFESKVNAGMSSQKDFSTISSAVANINKMVNVTMVTHGHYLTTVVKSNSRYLYYIDRLTYGRNPNVSTEEYPVPDYKRGQEEAKKIEDRTNIYGYVKLDTINIADKKINVYINGPTKSAITAYIKNEKDPSILLPVKYFTDNNEKYYKFVMQHEYGHIINNDKVNVSKTLVYNMLGRQDPIEERADAYSAKNNNLSKNEFEKMHNNLRSEAKTMYTDAGVKDKDVDRELKHLEGREKHGLKTWNKKV